MGSVTQAEIDRLERILSTSSLVAMVFVRWSSLVLPNCWLAAGVVAQTVWNLGHGRAPEYGVKDIDLVYFDPVETSADAERRSETRIQRLFAHRDVHVDAKNQARVHLWYKAKFGYAIAPYVSVEAAIAAFPTTATAIGVRPRGAGLEVLAPFGLGDLFTLTVRPNKAQITQQIYEAKIARWRQHWPELKVIGWDASG